MENSKMTDFEKALLNPPKKYRPAPFWSWNEKLNVTDCIECGCCAYSCPQRLYLIQSMRIAKEKLRIRKQQQKEAAK